MAAPPASKLDHTQILKHSFIDATGELRVSATATIGTVDVVIDAVGGDNIAISDGADTLNINPNGSINVEGPLTDAELRASPVPISVASLPLPTGASTSALQTTGNTTLSSLLTELQLKADLTETQPVSVASLPLPTGAATLAEQQTQTTKLTSIDSKLTSPITVTGPLTNAELRATPVPISGTVTANLGTIAGVATETTLSTLNTKIPANLTVTATRLLVDGSGVTQPISATSLPLPTGAATSANQTTANTSLASIDSKLTAPLVTTSKIELTPAAPTFYGVTNVSGVAVPANANRKGLVLVNTSTATISLSFGANPAVLNSGITLNPNGGTWVMDEYTFTTQAVNAISNAATRNLAIQEFNT